MKREIVKFLSCPVCHGDLTLEPAGDDPWEEVLVGTLRCHSGGHRFGLSRGVPRFVASDDYTASFSFEWRRFARVQLDSARGWTASEERFRQSLDFPLEELKGKLILDAGCGMGRFAEIAAKYGGTVMAVDLSYAVDVAAGNLAPYESVHMMQADLRALPFRPGSFDLIYSLGVLHHAPDPRQAFAGLVPYLKPGGRISITLYSGSNKVYVASTNFWRRITTRLPKKIVYYMAHWAIPAYYMYRIPVLGLVGRAVFPICCDPDREWRLLDTFDCYSPAYQSYHSHPEVYRWFKEAGLTEIAVLDPGISFIGVRPKESRAAQGRR